jgi:hypothetical protein
MADRLLDYEQLPVECQAQLVALGVNPPYLVTLSLGRQETLAETAQWLVCRYAEMLTPTT